MDKKEEAETIKKQLLGFTASGVFDNYRSSVNLEVYTQFIILDIDKLSESELNIIIPVINLAPYSYACFICARGKGVMFTVRVNSNVEQHKTVYNQVIYYYKKALNKVVDTLVVTMQGCVLCLKTKIAISIQKQQLMKSKKWKNKY